MISNYYPLSMSSSNYQIATSCLLVTFFCLVRPDQQSEPDAVLTVCNFCLETD